MSEKKDYRVFCGFVEENYDGTAAYVFVQGSNPRSLEDAMKFATEVEGWVEEDGVIAHVDNGTKIDY